MAAKQLKNSISTDNECYVQAIVDKIETNDAHWSIFAEYVNNGPPKGYSLAQGLVWMHELSAILCKAGLATDDANTI